MKLGFHYHIPAVLSEDQKLMVPGYLGVFLDSLAHEFEQIVCFMHSPLPSEAGMQDYVIKADNVSLVDLGVHNSTFMRALNAGRIAGRVKNEIAQLDYMLIRGPTPLMSALGMMCRKLNVPVSMMLVGDYLEGLAAAKTMHPLKRRLLKFYYEKNKRQQDALLGEEPVFANSQKLFEEYDAKAENAVLIRTTTLSRHDFYQRPDTCGGETLQLLFTGRIDPTKGIEDIFQAVSLFKTDRKVVVNLVGWETSKGFLARLEDLAAQLGIAYVFHGKKSVGPELFDMYKKADVYMLASRGDFEGFPRTLWEAMAHSTPLIATGVGAIPYFLEDGVNAMLVRPNAPEALAEALEKLVRDETFRKTIIANGYALALSNTNEIQSARIADVIRTSMAEAHS